MIENLKSLITNTEDSETKTILFQILIRIKMLEDNQISEKQLSGDLLKIYKDFLKYKKSTNLKSYDYDKDAVHIVFGGTQAGSIAQMLKNQNLLEREAVISFDERFSIGPIWNLHENEGIQHRSDWIVNHINLENEQLEDYQETFIKKIDEIKSIETKAKIVIWVGDNAHEQTALSYILYTLKNHSNEIQCIHATKDYQEIQPDDTYVPLHIGEMLPESLSIIYDLHKNSPALSAEEKKVYEDNWEDLATKTEVLRIWSNQRIQHVAENYYDDDILAVISHLHNEQKEKDFIKASRIIGELLGRIKQDIGDLYFEYRMRMLLFQGKLEIKGVPKAWRYYSVRKKEYADY
ncbi:hypothetical protein BTS2_2038 [Bacillus sp. TS-2]|nr:hypothetical protein BTS2_2038 [Bacillus sp. TS-2]